METYGYIHVKATEQGKLQHRSPISQDLQAYSIGFYSKKKAGDRYEVLSIPFNGLFFPGGNVFFFFFLKYRNFQHQKNQRNES